MDIEEFAGIPARWLEFSEIEVISAAYLIARKPLPTGAEARRLRDPEVRHIAREICTATGAVLAATMPEQRTTITQQEFRAQGRKWPAPAPAEPIQTDPDALAGGCYDIFTASKFIAEQLGYSSEESERLLASMARAAFDPTVEQLQTRSNLGYDKYAKAQSRPEKPNCVDSWVTVEDVNNWAQRSGFQWRWTVPESVGTCAAEEPSLEAVGGRRKKKSWRDVDGQPWRFAVKLLRDNHCSSAKELYSLLEAAAAQEGSPFVKGQGPSRGTLFIPAVNSTLALQTLRNAWPDLRKASSVPA